MFPEPTELLLIGYLIESNWTPKSKSNTLTPKTNSQTCWPREISRMMNGIIFCVCLTLAISVLQSVLKWCRKEQKNMQVKKESQQNRNRWWFWSRDAAKGLLMCYLLLHQKAWRKPDMKVKLLSVRKLRSTIGRGDPLWAHSTRTDSLLKTMGRILTPKQNQNCRQDPDHSCTGWMIKCERGKNNPQKMPQKAATNILWYGECLSLQHCKYRYSWWRITQTIGIPSEIQKISHWNRCSTYSEKLISEQSDEIYGENNYLGRLFMEVFVFDWWWTSHQSLAHKGLRILRFCKMNENPQSNIAWEDRLTWFKCSSEYRALDRIDGEPMEFEWNIFAGFTTLQLCHKSPRVTVKIERNTREIYWTDHLHVDVQRHLMGI